MNPLFQEDGRTLRQRGSWVTEFEKSGTRRAILGTNRWAISVAKQFDIEYFLDDNLAETTLLGKPVLPVNGGERDVMTLSCALMRPLTARHVLQSVVDSQLDYYSFLRFTSAPVMGIEFLSDREIWEPASTVRLANVRENLYDEESKETWDRVVRLRRDFDLDAMVVFSDRQATQYFEPFLELGTCQSFLDVGGFDGFTTQCAIERYGSDLRCHIFEPNHLMMSHLHEKFSLMRNVEIHEFGLSSLSGHLQFESDGSSSRTGSGSQRVSVRALDELGFTSADFIKVDIEGGEDDFLRGASRTITTLEPLLAIACYHKNEQLVSIYEKVRMLLPESRVYLRHYTEGFPETDIFFVPPRFW